MCRDRDLAMRVARTEVEAALQALDERLGLVEKMFRDYAHAKPFNSEDARRAYSKAGGVALARSYITDALRGVP